MLTRWAVFECGVVTTVKAVHVCEDAARADAHERTLSSSVPHEAIQQIISSQHVFEEYERLREAGFSIK